MDGRTMTEDLTRLLSPKSIAIIGVSQDQNKLNGRVMTYLLDKGYDGEIYPVNPRYEEVAGYTCYPSITAAPKPIDLAIITLPARMVQDALVDCGAADVFGAVIFSSGFGEVGEAGRRMEDDLVTTAREAGVRVVGPNCLGMINAFDNALSTFSQYAAGPTPAGPVAFVTQSGAFGTAISALARNRGIGLGYFINTGNECDLDFAAMMSGVLDDTRVSVGAGYLEGVKDGDGFVAVADKALALGKPLVLTKVGRSEAGSRAAASHTGSLAGEDAVFDGIVRQYGVIRARNEEHMLDIVQTFASTSLPAGRGVGIVTQSGGAAVLMADRAEEAGPTVAALSDKTKDELQEVVPAFGAVGNPVDVTAQFLAEPSILINSVRILLEDPAVDIAVVWLQLMDNFVDELHAVFREIKETVNKPFVVCWLAASDRALEGMRELGICTLRGAEPAIDAVAALIGYAESCVAHDADADARAAIELPVLDLPDEGGAVPALKAAEILEAAGVAVVDTRFVINESGLQEAAEELGYPLALKIESPDIAHKTEAGGVKVGLKTWEEAQAAFEEIFRDARFHDPDAQLHGAVVQPMATGTVELVVGLKRDPVFGPVVMAGIGGVFVEVMKDVAFRRAPVTEAEACAMLNELRGAPMLDGVRGQPPVNKDAVAQLIAAVSRLGAAAGDRLVELDVNPVLAGPDGAVAVDWLMVLETAESARTEK
jgi:acetyltransferase